MTTDYILLKGLRRTSCSTANKITIASQYVFNIKTIFVTWVHLKHAINSLNKSTAMHRPGTTIYYTADIFLILHMSISWF